MQVLILTYSGIYIKRLSADGAAAEPQAFSISNEG